ncbi:MAG TPA: class I SAM-dependent methyltransferase [Anaerolineales bacterium]
MAEHMNLYQRAIYYDVIFDRDVSREADFITQAYQQYSGETGPAAVLDLACGPGYHALEFARRGVAATGLDLGKEMLTLAREKGAAQGLPVHWIEGDMRSFTLERPVDAAFIMFDGLDALLSNEDLVTHLRAVGQALNPGGVYLVDLTHPRECSFQSYGSYGYRGRRNGVDVEIRWATNSPHFDLVTGVAEVELELYVRDNGREILVKDKARERLLLPQEICLLAEKSGLLQVVGWHGDYDVRQPLDNSQASRRMIAVLQRVG